MTNIKIVAGFALTCFIFLATNSFGQDVTYDNLTLDDGDTGSNQEPFLQFQSQDGNILSWIWARNFGQLDFSHNEQTFMTVDSNVIANLITLDSNLVTVFGEFEVASSKELKTGIKRLSTEEAKSTLAEMEPVKFRYKVAPERELIGFVAESSPKLITNDAHNGISPMKIISVLTKVVQDQQSLIARLEERVALLEEK